MGGLHQMGHAHREQEAGFHCLIESTSVLEAFLETG